MQRSHGANGSHSVDSAKQRVHWCRSIRKQQKTIHTEEGDKRKKRYAGKERRERERLQDAQRTRNDNRNKIKYKIIIIIWMLRMNWCEANKRTSCKAIIVITVPATHGATATWSAIVFAWHQQTNQPNRQQTHIRVICGQRAEQPYVGCFRELSRKKNAFKCHAALASREMRWNCVNTKNIQSGTGFASFACCRQNTKNSKPYKNIARACRHFIRIAAAPSDFNSRRTISRRTTVRTQETHYRVGFVVRSRRNISRKEKKKSNRTHIQARPLFRHR